MCRYPVVCPDQKRCGHSSSSLLTGSGSFSGLRESVSALGSTRIFQRCREKMPSPDYTRIRHQMSVSLAIRIEIFLFFIALISHYRMLGQGDHPMAIAQHWLRKLMK